MLQKVKKKNIPVYSNGTTWQLREVSASLLNTQHQPAQKQDTSEAKTGNAGLDGPSFNYSNRDTRY